MNTIIIDPTTGHVGTTSMLQTSFTPGLHISSIGRAIKRTLKLESYTGPKTTRSTIGGKKIFTAPFETCEFILDNINGCSGWNEWRENSGQEFKQALRKRVEKVLNGASDNSVQKQGPPRQPRPEQELEVGAKTAALEKALGSINTTGSFGSVRIDESTGKASIIDVIRMLCIDASCDYASQMCTRILDKDDRVTSIKSRTTRLRINGRGRPTPVTDFNTLVEVIWMLPCRASRSFRRKSAETICRVMGGDLSLCRQIEQNNLMWGSIDRGEVTRQALIEPVEYKQEGMSNKVRESSVRDALASLVAGRTEVETPSGFIDVLSDTQVIEVKYYRKWKDGLGQVFAYQSHYPRLARRLHLFAHHGDVDTNKYFELAKSVCDTHAVEVTFEQVAEVELELESVVVDDELSTVNGDEEPLPCKNEWDELALLGVRKRSAVLEAETEWAVVDKKRAVLEGCRLDALIAAIV